METLNKIKTIVAEGLSVNENDISLESTFNELGADSLDIVELIMSIEEEFDVEIPDEDAENMKNIGDIVSYIDNK